MIFWAVWLIWVPLPYPREWLVWRQSIHGRDETPSRGFNNCSLHHTPFVFTVKTPRNGSSAQQSSLPSLLTKRGSQAIPSVPGRGQILRNWLGGSGDSLPLEGGDPQTFQFGGILSGKLIHLSCYYQEEELPSRCSIWSQRSSWVFYLVVLDLISYFQQGSPSPFCSFCHGVCLHIQSN